MDVPNNQSSLKLQADPVMYNSLVRPCYSAVTSQSNSTGLRQGRGSSWEEERKRSSARHAARHSFEPHSCTSPLADMSVAATTPYLRPSLSRHHERPQLSRIER